MSTCYLQLDQLEPRYLMSAALPTPVAPPSSLALNEQNLAADNTDFAFNLYHQLETQSGNIFFSPESISAAMAMLYAGASGQTAQQIANVMSFLLPNGDFASAFGSLLADLNGPQPAGADGQTPTLDIANSLWGQTGYPFLSSYLQTLSQSFQSEMHTVDFLDNPEAQRTAINQWVADNTGQMIQNLLPQGIITKATRLVLANAIYFNAPWLYSFSQTVQQAFHLPGGDVNVDMMTQEENYSYASGSNYQAVEIPYVGNESMVVLLPTAGQFDQFDSSLTASEVQGIEQKMQPSDVVLSLPKFGYEQTTDLTQTLQKMGITDAFDPGSADLSGIDGNNDLYVSAVIHKAKIEVTAQGTKAAGATAIVVTTAFGCFEKNPTPQPIDVTVDHPFIYLIKDNTTGSTLFMGRVSDASAFPPPVAQTANPAGPDGPFLITLPTQNPTFTADPAPVALPPQNPTSTVGPSSSAAPMKHAVLAAQAADLAAAGAKTMAAYRSHITLAARLPIAPSAKLVMIAIAPWQTVFCDAPSAATTATEDGPVDDLGPTLFSGLTHLRIK
jgi:serpin B